MGESEARLVTFVSSPEPKPEAEHQADLRDITREKQVLESITLRVFAAPGLATRRPSRDISRTEEKQELIFLAAREAGSGRGSVKRFCEFLDRDQVPIPNSLHTIRDKGVKTWLKAHDYRELQSSIRGFKSRVFKLRKSTA